MIERSNVVTLVPRKVHPPRTRKAAMADPLYRQIMAEMEEAMTGKVFTPPLSSSSETSKKP